MATLEDVTARLDKLEELVLAMCEVMAAKPNFGSDIRRAGQLYDELKARREREAEGQQKGGA